MSNHILNAIENISKETLVNLLSTAIYGSSWASCRLTLNTPENKNKLKESDNDCREDIWAKALLEKQTVTITDCTADGTAYSDKGTCPDGDEAEYVISLQNIKDGLKAASKGTFKSDVDFFKKKGKEYVESLLDEDSGDFDADAADTLLQIILFDDVVIC